MKAPGRKVGWGIPVIDEQLNPPRARVRPFIMSTDGPLQRVHRTIEWIFGHADRRCTRAATWLIALPWSFREMGSRATTWVRLSVERNRVHLCDDKDLIRSTRYTKRHAHSSRWNWDPNKWIVGDTISNKSRTTLVSKLRWWRQSGWGRGGYVQISTINFRRAGMPDISDRILRTSAESDRVFRK